jgi:hypothetical protein
MAHANFTKGTKICPRPNCPSKGAEQPIANFATNKALADGLKNECRACQAIAAQEKKVNGTKPRVIIDKPEVIKKHERMINELSEQKQKDKHIKTAVALLTKPKKNEVSVTHTEEIAGNLMHSFGGPKAFADELVNTIHSCENEGHKIRGLLGAAAIFKDASQIQAANAQELDLCSDEELEERIRHVVQQMQSAGAIDVEFISEVTSEELG